MTLIPFPVEAPKTDTRGRKNHGGKNSPILRQRKRVAHELLPLIDQFDQTFRAWDNQYAGGVLGQLADMKELCQFWADISDESEGL